MDNDSFSLPKHEALHLAAYLNHHRQTNGLPDAIDGILDRLTCQLAHGGNEGVNFFGEFHSSLYILVNR